MKPCEKWSNAGGLEPLRHEREAARTAHGPDSRKRSADRGPVAPHRCERGNRPLNDLQSVALSSGEGRELGAPDDVY